MAKNFEKKHVDSIAKFAEIELKMAMRRKEGVLQHVNLFLQKVYKIISIFKQTEKYCTYINQLQFYFSVR